MDNGNNKKKLIDEISRLLSDQKDSLDDMSVESLQGLKDTLSHGHSDQPGSYDQHDNVHSTDMPESISPDSHEDEDVISSVTDRHDSHKDMTDSESIDMSEDQTTDMSSAKDMDGTESHEDNDVRMTIYDYDEVRDDIYRKSGMTQNDDMKDMKDSHENKYVIYLSGPRSSRTVTKDRKVYIMSALTDICIATDMHDIRKSDDGNDYVEVIDNFYDMYRSMNPDMSEDPEKFESLGMKAPTAFMTINYDIDVLKDPKEKESPDMGEMEDKSDDVMHVRADEPKETVREATYAPEMKKGMTYQKLKDSLRKAMKGQTFFNIVAGLLIVCLVIAQCYIILGMGSSADNGAKYDVVESKVTDIQSDITDIIDKVTDSTVGVISQSSAKGNQSATVSSGSGVVYKVSDKTAYIITNNHVVDGGSALQVVLSNGEYIDAVLVGGDEYGDIAVLSVKVSSDIKPISIGDSDLLERGETVLAIGCPLGIEYAGTVTRGIVSNTDVNITLDTNENGTYDSRMQVIQTDAAVNPGNSGGALVNAAGELVGITNSKAGGTSVEGIGYAIPVNDAVKLAEEIIETGKVSRPWLGISGVSLGDISAFEAFMYGISTDETSGFYVTSVEEGSSADIAGIKEGDIILLLDGNEIDDYVSLRTALFGKSIGDKVKITIRRDGSKKTVNATLQGN